MLGHKLSEKSNFETPEGFPTEARVPSKIIERLRFMFTPNGKREFVPRDQVFPLFFV